MKAILTATLFAVSLCGPATQAQAQSMGPPGSEPKIQSCFVLYDLSGGEISRTPSAACSRRVSPGATFDIPHALAALDGGIVQAQERIGADSGGNAGGSDQTLDSALQFSAPWYFQRIAQRLGAQREREYMVRFNYGNADTSSGATNFWDGGSLKVSPDEQLLFLRRFFRDELSVNRQMIADVRSGLRQPPGVVVGSFGVAPFGATPPRDDTSVAAKSASTVMDGREGVRWLVGQVKRGTRQYVFVSCVTGPKHLPQNAAVSLAERELRRANVF